MTIRPDADAFGAMAVLCLRAAGGEITPEISARIKQIADGDRAVTGPWPGVEPVPDSYSGFVDMLDADNEYAALREACTDRDLSPEERVRLVLDWLVSGHIPSRYAQQAKRSVRIIAESWANGKTVLRPMLGGRVAFVRSPLPGALRLGYRIAPVVLSLNPDHFTPAGERLRKFTICQWGRGWADLKKLAHRLSAIEPGWGGSRTIIGSPQAGGSQLPLARIVVTLAGLLIEPGLTQPTGEERVNAMVGGQTVQ